MSTTFDPPTRPWVGGATLATVMAAAAVGVVAQQRAGGALLPHAFCINASSTLLNLHLVSDSLIAFAYLLIPWAMLHFTRRRPDLPFRWVSWVFGVFIVACGLTHAFEVWTLYYPVYWISGAMKAVTAAASLATAWLLYRAMPVALAMPSAQQLRDANAALSAEIRAREAAQVELSAAKAEVERLLQQVQRQANETAAILQRFFEEAPMGMALVRTDGHLMRSNDAMQRIVDRELSGGRQLPQAAEGAFLEVQQGAPRRDVEIALANRSAQRVVRCSFFPISRGGESLFGWIAQDVSEEIAAAREKSQALESLAEANRKAREESAQFQALADNIAQLAWMTDASGWIHWYNRRWFEYTGTDLEQMQGWGWKAVHHPDHVRRVEDKFRAHLASGQAWEDTFPLRGADGRFRWFLSRAFPLHGPDGRILRWFGTNTDVNEQVLAQQKLREADRRKDEFIAALAHELRNPLAPVRSSAEILSRVNHDDPRSRRGTGILLRQVSHMARLIDDLLDVARVNEGKLEIKPQACDLAQIVDTVCHDYAFSLQASGNNVVAQVDRPLPLVADPVRIAQAVGNFLQNAARFAPGTRVEVTASTQGSDAVVRVRDFGDGIAPDLLPRLFEPFTQGPQDLSRSRGGLGLGLALTRGIALLHGGAVAAMNHENGGAVFELRVPLSPR